ncbi:hypothetical protein CF319_g2676 [Tilletia indica]|uniref:Uncharacterized protein n=1 Tax=Tilletia indica TaxID=43049 RepID=A0A8T8T3W3_9BASI|nr:hypothetical protein CF319_g2676 [Tilletia indica]KAE8254448.1 hypothetical protein A4X13_0g3409 [Tilletia indica]
MAPSSPLSHALKAREATVHDEDIKATDAGETSYQTHHTNSNQPSRSSIRTYLLDPRQPGPWSLDYKSLNAARSMCKALQKMLQLSRVPDSRFNRALFRSGDEPCFESGDRAVEHAAAEYARRECPRSTWLAYDGEYTLISPDDFLIDVHPIFNIALARLEKGTRSRSLGHLALENLRGTTVRLVGGDGNLASYSLAQDLFALVGHRHSHHRQRSRRRRHGRTGPALSPSALDTLHSTHARRRRSFRGARCPPMDAHGSMSRMAAARPTPCGGVACGSPFWTSILARRSLRTWRLAKTAFTGPSIRSKRG